MGISQPQLAQELVEEPITVDDRLEAIQKKWIDSLSDEDRVQIEETIPLGFLRQAIDSRDYKKLVLITLELNQAAKLLPYIKDYLYCLKELILAKAAMLAAIDAPQYSWGARHNGMSILYFDLPGYGQYSFHMPRMNRGYSPCHELFSEIPIPRYHGSWNQKHEDSPEYMNLDWAQYITEKGPQSIGIKKIKDILTGHGPLSPRIAHDLYCCAMGHPDFQNNKEEIQGLLFPHTETIPEAISHAFTSKIYKLEIFRLKEYRKYIGAFYGDISHYINELTRLAEYAKNERSDTSNSDIYKCRCPKDQGKKIEKAFIKKIKEKECKKCKTAKRLLKESELAEIREKVLMILKPAYKDFYPRRMGQLRTIQKKIDKLLRKIGLSQRAFYEDEVQQSKNHMNPPPSSANISDDTPQHDKTLMPFQLQW